MDDVRRGDVQAERSHPTTGEDAGWYRSPAQLGGIVLVLTAGLYLLSLGGT